MNGNNGQKSGTPQLPDSSRKALVYIADQLRRGFSGRFEIDCYQGGVRNMRESKDLQPKDLPHSAGTPA